MSGAVEVGFADEPTAAVIQAAVDHCRITARVRRGYGEVGTGSVADLDVFYLIGIILVVRISRRILAGIDIGGGRVCIRA